MTSLGKDGFPSSPQRWHWTHLPRVWGSQERPSVHSVILEPHPTLLNHLNEPSFPQSSVSLDQMWPSSINREQASWFCQPSHTLPYFKIIKIAMPSSLCNYYITWLSQGRKIWFLSLSTFQNSWIIRLCDRFHQADHTCQQKLWPYYVPSTVIEMQRYLRQPVSYLQSALHVCAWGTLEDNSCHHSIDSETLSHQ